MTTNKEWPCSHIEKNEDGWTYIVQYKAIHGSMVPEDILFCSRCGAKRPEKEPVDLWTLILPFHHEEVCKKLMARVIEHFIKEISYIGVSNPELFSTEVFRFLNKELEKCK